MTVFLGGRMDGTVSPPPSKSLTHRAIVLASMARGESVISNPLVCDDTMATVGACGACGSEIDLSDGRMTVSGGDLHAPSEVIDAGNSGTTLRFMTGLCSLFGSESVLTGDGSLRRRPMAPLLDSLSSMGAACGMTDGRVRVRGPVSGGDVTVDGGVSSQFVSSLMMAAPAMEGDTHITIEGRTLSAPYIDMTADMMRRFGAEVSVSDGRVRVRGGTGYRPCDIAIPADGSSAAFALAAGALGGRVTVKGIDPDDRGGDWAFLDILEGAGADVRTDGDTVTVTKGRLEACDIDMSGTPDLFPVTAVLMSAAEGESTLYGAPHLRLKESDRIALTAGMLESLGGNVRATDDGCVVTGTGTLRGGSVNHGGDHRIAMSAAVASIICREGVTVDSMDCCSVSYPGFLEDMGSIGLEMR